MMKTKVKFGYVQTGGSSVSSPTEEKGHKIFQADFKIGDEILKLSNQKIAIKIDVERSEMDVLRGSKELLEGNDCLIQLECENKNQKEVLEFLSKIGYANLNLKGDNDDLYFANFKIE